MPRDGAETLSRDLQALLGMSFSSALNTFENFEIYACQ